jgi:adenylosuccinate lyase
MGKIWTEEARFKYMLEVEVAACEAMAKLNLIPKDAAKKIRQKANFDLSQVNKYEQVTKHDVTAFLKSIADFVGPEARFIHKGLTSSDVLDTALSKKISPRIDRHSEK